MKEFIDGLNAWMKTRDLPDRQLTAEELNTLRKAVAFESKCKSFISLIWKVFVDLCAVAAAVFSALTYFKQ